MLSGTSETERRAPQATEEGRTRVLAKASVYGRMAVLETGRVERVGSTSPGPTLRFQGGGGRGVPLSSEMRLTCVGAVASQLSLRTPRSLNRVPECRARVGRGSTTRRGVRMKERRPTSLSAFVREGGNQEAGGGGSKFVLAGLAPSWPLMLVATWLPAVLSVRRCSADTPGSGRSQWGGGGGSGPSGAGGTSSSSCS